MAVPCTNEKICIRVKSPLAGYTRESRAISQSNQSVVYCRSVVEGGAFCLICVPAVLHNPVQLVKETFFGKKRNNKNYASYYRAADFTAVKCQREGNKMFERTETRAKPNIFQKREQFVLLAQTFTFV